MMFNFNTFFVQSVLVFIAMYFQIQTSKCVEVHSYDNLMRRTILRRQAQNSSDSSNPSVTSDFESTLSPGADNDSEQDHSGSFFGYDWERVSSPFIICLWVIFAGMSKISLQLIPKLVSRVPESCILICVGLAVGGMAYNISSTSRLSYFFFNTDAFFLYILPPIVMEAGYFMPKRFFFGNAGTIFLYAFVGTVFNALAIGGALYSVYMAGFMPGLREISQLNLLDCFLFGSIISAVDPVAVISVFEEIHVNNNLYICVFGESLLNDGVVVLLYNLFERFLGLGAENIQGIHIFYAFLSFFLVVIGALFIGLFYGYLCSFITKYTVKNRIIEPTFVFAFCYLSYLTAEIFHLSGIIAAVVAAFTMSSYVDQNISAKSHTTVKYALKMLANIAETLIFMVLGIATVSNFWEKWNTGFVLWTLLFCLVFRAVGVYVLTAVANTFRLDKINKVDQFVMAYGGLRGAIAFSLVSLVNEATVPLKDTMVCACIVVILFTSFVQGATVRPIVELLNVKTTNKHSKTMFEVIALRLIDHLMAGIEDVIGHHGHHYWMQKLHELHNNYVGKLFVRTPFKTRNEKLFETFHQINRREAEDIMMEFEKSGVGASTNELRQVFTFSNLMPLLDTRKTFASSSSVEIRRPKKPRPEATVDLNREHVGEKQPVITQEADMHHLLQQSMYKTRRIEKTFYRRGFIDEDLNQNQEEDEILLRHKMGLTKKRRHHKHKHGKRNQLLVKSPSSSQKIRPNLSDPSFRQTFSYPKSGSSSTHDVGLTFTAPVSRPSSRGPLSFLNVFEAVQEDPATETLMDTSSAVSVAIDRELPWKRITTTEAVADPQGSSQNVMNADARLSNNVLRSTFVESSSDPKRDSADRSSYASTKSDEAKKISQSSHPSIDINIKNYDD